MNKLQIPLAGGAIAVVVAASSLCGAAPKADAGAPLHVRMTAGRAAAPTAARETCTPLKTTSDRATTVVPAASASVSGQARVITFANGTRQVLPPTRWTPVRATDAELAAYGFEARPADATQRAQWTAKYGKWKQTGIDAPCVTNAHSGLSTSASSNWSGLVDNCAKGNCTRASGVWYQPNLSKETCSTPSTHSIWAGLGGVNDRDLIQGGLDQTGRAWWEVISGDKDTYMTYFNSHVFPAGDEVQADALYYPATKTAAVQVLDITTGYGVKWSGTTAPDNAGGTGQFAASSAWTGTSAEYVDERVTVDGSLGAYRQAASGKTYWWNALTDTRGHRLNPTQATFVPEAVSMLNGSHTLGGVQMLTSSSWNDTTKACS